ncbi:MAG: DUF1501 domain-containing protein [bacterium]
MSRLYGAWYQGYYDHPQLQMRLPDAHIQYPCVDDNGNVNQDLRSECTSTLYGQYTELILEPDIRARLDERGNLTMWSGILKASEWQKLQAPGRLLATQQLFWEKAVDDVLEQYLDYDLGNLVPTVRDELVRYFLEYGGDIRALHFAVVTSVPYLQSATNSTPTAYRWTFGPLRQVGAEAWIDSMKSMTGYDIGDCDHRLTRPDDFLETETVAGVALVERSNWRFDDNGVDYSYRNVARGLGGCPDNSVGGRFKIISILTTAQQLNFVNRVCDPAFEGRGADIASLLPAGVGPNDALSQASAAQIFSHQIGTFFGRLASEEEIAELSRSAKSARVAPRLNLHVPPVSRCSRALKCSSTEVTMSHNKNFGRRSFLKGVGLATAGVAMPHVWVPKDAYAQTAARGEIKHVIYVRLNGGFRFTTAFNGEVAERFNPWGKAAKTADGTEWGAADLLAEASWLTGDDGAARAALGMKPVTEISNQIAVLPCVDHEPTSGSADGNHSSGLQRFATGYASNGTGIFTMINYGLRDRVPQNPEEILLPSFVLGGGGMANGVGKFAGYRPPVLQEGFSGFGFDAAKSLPDWARRMSDHVDQRTLERAHPQARPAIDAYIQSREATKRYSEIFTNPALDVSQRSDDPFDGISNNQLRLLLGDNGTARNIMLALRLFHFGAPAVFMNQGGYDMHSGEEEGLPPRMNELNQLISGLYTALNIMDHPAGGKYWDHTLVLFGSEFGRTTRGGKFNSARGSDHGGDFATRWMSMPVMGGVISAAGNGGRSFGETALDDLRPLGKVYSYRSLMKTVMDMLGCDHSEFFPADEPFNDLVT